MMNLDELKINLKTFLDEDELKFNEPMKNHTSFKVGGPCDIMVIPKSKDNLIKSLELIKKYNVPYFIMGKGSNLIVKDGGFRGVILKLTGLDYILVRENKIIAGGGASLSNTAREALLNSLKGMEFASGIPGTVGGAVAMNAGAYGGEIKDIIEWAECVDENLNLIKLTREELNLSYRHSRVQDENLVVVEACFNLEKGNYDEIRGCMEELNRRRLEKQPLNYPSAGSTFKRPPGYFAGKLIEDAGLKGYRFGGAMVSEKHAGFVINYDNATAKDVLEVIKHVQKTVYEKFGVTLETEVKIIGED
ncbi:UDP-N-acetylmuramate dehydrogenase [Thermobrachium celere]|uniref:UDP-N-acetylenolpyruvoylglucosamine reductase n=1 Tax=Thermobrachium celere DSM 8682 TaxID=941824 RepID=R7RSN7_9CLOT|nr:UDP-N-acetylmuramate dehydrogenase [Thermobrachium celere]CDF58270.1 UDP-N-acetylenolpyruvoylglucosamine reductase [Thermobrachium celere DSM 8682]